MRQSTRIALWLGVSGLVIGIGSCRDDGERVAGPGVGSTTLDTVAIVSDPVAGSPSGARAPAGGGAAAPVVEAHEEFAFVSLAPGTLPGGASVTIRNRRTRAVVTTGVVDGGIDPIAVPAHAGDTLDVVATDAAGATVYAGVSSVPVRRPSERRTRARTRAVTSRGLKGLQT